jgi:hypothetical protein
MSCTDESHSGGRGVKRGSSPRPWPRAGRGACGAICRVCTRLRHVSWVLTPGPSPCAGRGGGVVRGEARVEGAEQSAGHTPGCARFCGRASEGVPECTRFASFACPSRGAEKGGRRRARGGRRGHQWPAHANGHECYVVAGGTKLTPRPSLPRVQRWSEGQRVAREGGLVGRRASGRPQVAPTKRPGVVQTAGDGD